MNCQPELAQVSPPPLWLSFLWWWALLKRLHRFLVTEPDNRVKFRTQETGLRQKHQHTGHGFLVIGAVIGTRLVPFPISVSQWHQPPFTGRIIMFQGAITVQSTSTIMAVG